MVVELVEIQKRPVRAYAFQWDGTNIPLEVLQEKFPDIKFHENMFRKCGRDEMRVLTFHGYSHVSIGDWIIVAPWGEIYCNIPSVFEEAWMKLDEEQEDLS